MKFQVSSSLEYAVFSPSTIILNIHVLKNLTQTVLEESLDLNPLVAVEELISAAGENRYIRFESNECESFKIDYQSTIHVKTRFIEKELLTRVPIINLPREVIPYLFPSRYCQSDRLFKLADDKFGKIEHPYEQVTAITQWIYNNVAYTVGSTTSETSAFDTVTQRVGVCRDFAHLAIALCRALSIPARYFAGYSFELKPQDFHACFEAYLGGNWIVFDATKLAPLNGLVRIATGRDAADTAVANIFGNVRLNTQFVNCELVGENFAPVFSENLKDRGLSLDR